MSKQFRPHTVCRIFVLSLACFTVTRYRAYTQAPVFQVQHPDFRTSPYTGMTREHWKDACTYLLKGAFSYLSNIDAPMLFPQQPGKSYPRSEQQVPTAKLEGLCRTLFLAAPLLREDSNIVINHIRMADYYRRQILLLCDSASGTFIPHRSPHAAPSQNLVEFGALAISLFTIPDILWDPLPQAGKDKLANLMLSYGDGPTYPSNWKFFNIFILSFFQSRGYPVNQALLEEYLQKILDHYRGDAWYNDNPAYDYYSMWAFQTYGIIWSEKFGKKYYPSYAARLVHHFGPLQDNYPYMFGKDGKMIMWGRSISYRMATIAPLPFTSLAGRKDTDYGWLRYISSNVLLQFLRNTHFLKDSIPTLGFYGAFEPAVQPYSCRGSVFWMGKAFLGLMLPKDAPFWTAQENRGPWEKTFQNNTVFNRFEDTAQLLITDYPNSGAAEIRAWCDVKRIGASEPFRSRENYNRLSYNSLFPWQADSSDGTVAMNYVFLNGKKEWEPLRLFTFQKFEQGIFYRDAVLETDSNVRMHLAEMPLPNGILRVDVPYGTDSISMRLGHYALPRLDKPIQYQTIKAGKHTAHIMDNGHYQLAMIPIRGWSRVEIRKSSHLHPEAEHSAVFNAVTHYTPSVKPTVYLTLLLWKKSGEKWTKSDLSPIRTIRQNSPDGPIQILFTDGTQQTIDFLSREKKDR